MVEVQCPYHHSSWRGRTQSILNSLRGNLLQPSLVNKFSSFVCVCPGREGAVPCEETVKEAPELSQWLTSKPPHSVCHTLQQYLRTAAQLTPERAGLGLVLLVSIIHKAAKGKLNEVPPELEPKSNEEQQWSLSLAPCHLGLLIGRDGQHIKPLCQEHRVSIYFGKKCQGRSSQEPNKKVCHRQRQSDAAVMVTVVRRREEAVDFELIKRELETRAESVRNKQAAHAKAVEEYRFKRHQWACYRKQRYIEREVRRLEDNTAGMHRDSKEAAVDHYHRKHQTKTRHPPRSHPHRAISEGHCLNCLSPYCPNLTEMGACSFHPGFLTAVKAGKRRGYRWTCCGRRTAQHRATAELHAHTGCSSGRHMWRAGRGSTKRNSSRFTNQHSNDIILI